MKLQVINMDGKKSSDIELSDKIFSVKPSKNLIQTIIDWQLNHFKPRTAKTKQRNEIKGSTAKIYAQKGTGGARHSSRKAPLFVGGGIAHGPKGQDNYKTRKSGPVPSGRRKHQPDWQNSPPPSFWLAAKRRGWMGL